MEDVSDTGKLVKNQGELQPQPEGISPLKHGPETIAWITGRNYILLLWLIYTISLSS